MIKKRITIKRETVILLVIFALALLLRLKYAWPAITGIQGFIQGDDDDYHRLAISLIQTGRLFDNGFLAYRMPFFPIVLAFVYSIFGDAPRLASLFMVLLSILTCLLTFFLGKEVYNTTVGVIAGFLTGVDLHLIYYSKLLTTETLFVFLVVSSMLSLERLRKTQRWQCALIAGVFLGLAMLTRVNFGFFIPFILVWIIYTARPNFRSATRNVIIVAAIVGGLWMAWICRNYLELRTFVPFTTQSGGIYYGVYNDVSSVQSNPLLYGHWLVLPKPDLTSASDEVELDHLLKRTAFHWIQFHPLQSVKISLMQAVHFWQPEFWGPAIPGYLLLVLASLIGFMWSIGQKNQSALLWVLLLILMTLATIFTIGLARFRLVLHPFLAITAGSAFFRSAQRIAVQWGNRSRIIASGKRAI